MMQPMTPGASTAANLYKRDDESARLRVENERLRAALEKIARGTWNVKKGETRPLREYAARVLRGEAP